MAATTRHGFPIGVQIVGRRFDDIGVLGMAKAFEGLRGAQKPWPITAEEVTTYSTPSWPGLSRPSTSWFRSRRE